MRYISHQMKADAKAYALANKSDPFAYSRAMTHLSVGIATADVRYEAKPIEVERRAANGQTYTVTEYHNVRRP